MYIMVSTGFKIFCSQFLWIRFIYVLAHINGRCAIQSRSLDTLKMNLLCRVGRRKDEGIRAQSNLKDCTSFIQTHCGETTINYGVVRNSRNDGEEG